MINRILKDKEWKELKQAQYLLPWHALTQDTKMVKIKLAKVPDKNALYIYTVEGIRFK